MTAATLQVDAALSQAVPSLPTGTTATTRRMEPTVFPIIGYGLTSDKLSIPQLRDLVKFQVLPLLTTIPDLAKVDMVGGSDAEVQVVVDPYRLDQYGLSLSDLVSALTAANVLQAIGHIEDHNKLYLVISSPGERGLTLAASTSANPMMAISLFASKRPPSGAPSKRSWRRCGEILRPRFPESMSRSPN
jgi:multidrug efflux pump subunit AcrB